MIYESSDWINAKAHFLFPPPGPRPHALPHHARGERQGDGVPSAWTLPPSEFHQQHRAPLWGGGSAAVPA